jgi:hypothetical protein
MSDIVISMDDRLMRFEADGTTWTFPVDYSRLIGPPAKWFWKNLDIFINEDGSRRSWNLRASTSIDTTPGFRHTLTTLPGQWEIFTIGGSDFAEADSQYRFDRETIGLSSYQYLAGSMLESRAIPVAHRSDLSLTINLDENGLSLTPTEVHRRSYSLHQPIYIVVN